MKDARWGDGGGPCYATELRVARWEFRESLYNNLLRYGYFLEALSCRTLIYINDVRAYSLWCVYGLNTIVSTTWNDFSMNVLSATCQGNNCYQGLVDSMILC